jgi:hypothetical protein
LFLKSFYVRRFEKSFESGGTWSLPDFGPSEGMESMEGDAPGESFCNPGQGHQVGRSREQELAGNTVPVDSFLDGAEKIRRPLDFIQDKRGVQTRQKTVRVSEHSVEDGPVVKRDIAGLPGGTYQRGSQCRLADLSGSGQEHRRKMPQGEENLLL